VAGKLGRENDGDETRRPVRSELGGEETSRTERR